MLQLEGHATHDWSCWFWGGFFVPTQIRFERFFCVLTSFFGLLGLINTPI